MMEKQLFRAKHKRILLVLDFLIVLSLVGHFGAIFLTNMLVMKATPGVQIVEANPATEAVHDFEPVTQDIEPQIRGLFFAFLFHAIGLGIVYGGYFYYRYKAIAVRDLWMLCTYAALVFIINMTDFTNNAGLWVGKILYA